ncbi:MAG: hypothetical protein JKX72_06240 [Robiginitomaculum sp.]|nr:hypothetical protein [Robiginitomaculum sp.]
MSVTSAAQELWDALETAKRPSGDEYIKIKDGSPEWMTEAVRACHQDSEILPDDFRYKFVVLAASAVSEFVDGEQELNEYVFEQLNNEHSFCVYYEMTQWLAGQPTLRMGYCDEVVEQYEAKGMSNIMSAAMLMEAEEVAHALIAYLSEHFADVEEAA